MKSVAINTNGKKPCVRDQPWVQELFILLTSLPPDGPLLTVRLTIFGFRMVRKRNTFSRHCTSNFEFGSFPGERYVGGPSLRWGWAAAWPTAPSRPSRGYPTDPRAAILHPYNHGAFHFQYGVRYLPWARQPFITKWALCWMTLPSCGLMASALSMVRGVWAKLCLTVSRLG